MSRDRPVLKDTQKATMPWQEVYSVTKSVIIDSRQRDCAKYKTPSFYRLDLGDTFKNINCIELKGCVIPKSSYNVHSSNNKIDFSVGDYLSGFQFLNRGAGYTSAPSITISSPPGPGVTATASTVIDSFGRISNIIITNAGSGYIPSRPPFLMIGPPQNQKEAVYPKVIAVIGTFYTAILRVGEYEIGGNPNPGGTPPTQVPTKLLLEIQDQMNYAVNGPPYVSGSLGPFAVRVVSQYPELTAMPGTPQSADTNACQFNRIQIVNLNSYVWELLWCTGPNENQSAASILGYNTVDSGIGIIVPPVLVPGGVLIPGGTAIRGYFDYNLKNDPEYVVMTIRTGDDGSLDRMTSLDDGLDNKFCVLLFDNNNPCTLHDLSVAPSGTIINVGGIQYLQGATGKGLFYREAGATKPIKGNDFDGPKKITFKPPQGKLNSMTIAFTKFGYKPGTGPQFYNMEGREHVLMFELTSSDNMSQMRE